MKNAYLSLRPASTAIAAVLAFSSPAVIAQTADPTAAAPPLVVTQPPASSAAPAPVIAPAPVVTPSVAGPIATVQPVPPPAIHLPPEPLAEAVQSAPTETRREASAPKPAPVNADRAAPAAANAAPVAGPVLAPSVDPIAVPVSSAVPVETSQPVPLAVDSVRDPNSVNVPDWLLPAGGVLLLLGGATVAVMMRRRTNDGIDNVLVPAGAMQRAAPAPVIPPATFAELDPIAQPVPAQVGRHATASKNPPVGSDAAQLEAMIAEAPSPENPFLTRKKRLCRADFLMRQGGVGESTRQEMPVTPAEPAPEVARTSTQKVSPTYSFGTKGTVKPRSTTKPSWA